jgi:hypothetical protein
MDGWCGGEFVFPSGNRSVDRPALIGNNEGDCVVWAVQYETPMHGRESGQGVESCKEIPRTGAIKSDQTTQTTKVSN